MNNRVKDMIFQEIKKYSRGFQMHQNEGKIWASYDSANNSAKGIEFDRQRGLNNQSNSPPCWDLLIPTFIIINNNVRKSLSKVDPSQMQEHFRNWRSDLNSISEGKLEEIRTDLKRFLHRNLRFHFRNKYTNFKGGKKKKKKKAL